MLPTLSHKTQSYCQLKTEPAIELKMGTFSIRSPSGFASLPLEQRKKRIAVDQLPNTDAEEPEDRLSLGDRKTVPQSDCLPLLRAQKHIQSIQQR